MQNFNVRQAGTAALFTLAFSQLLFVFECKNPKRTLFTAQYKNNPKLILAVLASVLVLLLAIGTDVGNLLFETEKLSPQAFVISIGLAVVYPIIRALVSLLFGEKTED
jgi:magnesium-transporting ATPase (P-type)